jgi:chromosome segregation ATPase
MKKLLVIGLLVVGGLWVCKNTNLRSYISTLCSRGQNALKNQIPRDLEIERLRNEITNLDKRVHDLLGPIAEKQVRIRHLEAELKNARDNQKKLHKDVLSLTDKVEAGAEPITFKDGDYSLADAKARLAADFNLWKMTESTLKSREQILVSLKRSVELSRKQLNTIAEQKRNFEARLARIEATQEYLNLRAVASPTPGGQGPVDDIERSMKDLERRLEVDVEKGRLEEQFRSQPTDGSRPGGSEVNTAQIRTELGATAPTAAPKVANNK